MRSFDYCRPASLSEAKSLLSEHGEEARILAGGTALLVLLKQRLFAPKVIVDIKDLHELDYVDVNGSLRLGALATHRNVEESPAVRKHFPVLAKAATQVAHWKIRTKGTVAGNLCQAEPASDLGTVLLAHDARVKISGASGEREVPLDQFYVGDYETVVQPGEILTETIVPFPEKGTSGLYYKFTPRSQADKPTVGVAVLLQLDPSGRTVLTARLALGNYGSTPLRCPKAEERLQGRAISEQLAAEVGRIAAGEGSPIDDVRASAEYRRHVVQVLIKRALLEISSRGEDQRCSTRFV